MRRFIFEDEMHAADAPEFSWTGTHIVGPVLFTFGSPAQQERFLAPMRRGEQTWAQGFSEPGSGLDLASLRTRADLRDGRYVVNGQKIWTSGAFEADWVILILRTDMAVKAKRGMSLLLVDLKSPGITVRRIPQINGEAHLCEVFLDNVEVPAENLVGEAGQGRTYAKFLLRSPLSGGSDLLDAPPKGRPSSNRLVRRRNFSRDQLTADEGASALSGRAAV